MVTWQSPVLFVQAPAHPAKLDPVSGVAVRVTGVPWSKSVVQVAPQSMPAGLLVTAPVPTPAVVTVSVLGMALKVAATDCAWSMVTTQSPVANGSLHGP